MNTDLIKLYQQLEGMEQTNEVKLLKDQTRETLYQNLRTHFHELTKIGRVIGFDELQNELSKGKELLEKG
jgi:site-specific DNA-adenine methylase